MTSYPTILGNGGQWDGYSAVNYTANRYSGVGLGQSAMVVAEPWNDSPGFQTESSIYQRIHVAGTVSDLAWGLDQSFSATKTLTFKLRKNSADTALSVQFGPGVTGWMTDSRDNVAVSVGDWLDFEADVGGTGSTSYTGSFYCASASFTATTGSTQLLAAVGPAVVPSEPFSYETHFNLLGILRFSPDTTAQFPALTSGTWEYMACHVDSTTFDASTTIYDRIGGTDGLMTIVIPSASLFGSGNFEDTTHSISVTAGALLDYGFAVSSSTGMLIMDWLGCHYTAATGSNCMIGGMPGEIPVIPNGGLGYTSLFGGGDFAPGSGSDVTRSTGAFPYDATLKDYANHVSDGVGTFTLMVNGVASTLAISSGGLTGWLMDSSDTVTVSAGDTCANRISANGSAGQSLVWQGAGLLVVAA